MRGKSQRLERKITLYHKPLPPEQGMRYVCFFAKKRLNRIYLIRAITGVSQNLWSTATATAVIKSPITAKKRAPSALKREEVKKNVFFS